jgi:hypothetical protein
VNQFVVLGEAHLREILHAYARYCNDIRTHRSLDKDAPVSRLVQRAGIINSLATLADVTSIRPGLGFRYAQFTKLAI